MNWHDNIMWLEDLQEAEKKDLTRAVELALDNDHQLVRLEAISALARNGASLDIFSDSGMPYTDKTSLSEILETYKGDHEHRSIIGITSPDVIARLAEEQRDNPFGKTLSYTWSDEMQPGRHLLGLVYERLTPEEKSERRTTLEGVLTKGEFRRYLIATGELSNDNLDEEETPEESLSADYLTRIAYFRGQEKLSVTFPITAVIDSIETDEFSQDHYRVGIGRGSRDQLSMHEWKDEEGMLRDVGYNLQKHPVLEGLVKMHVISRVLGLPQYVNLKPLVVEVSGKDVPVQLFSNHYDGPIEEPNSFQNNSPRYTLPGGVTISQKLADDFGLHLGQTLTLKGNLPLGQPPSSYELSEEFAEVKTFFEENPNV